MELEKFLSKWASLNLSWIPRPVFCSELWFDTCVTTLRKQHRGFYFPGGKHKFRGQVRFRLKKQNTKKQTEMKNDYADSMREQFYVPFQWFQQKWNRLDLLVRCWLTSVWKQLSSTLHKNKVSEIKCFKLCSFILMVTRAAAGNIFICNPKVTTAGRPANLFLLCSTTPVKNAR